ncbi:hypothetical protein ACIQM4_33695 [Streptomyces sp. NPDC091272]|uniref:hypothetical protein n=1 Tax=Streptomyces sp. NPDC091272 TaxID=3365981 RepID=UPI003808C3FC
MRRPQDVISRPRKPTDATVTDKAPPAAGPVDTVGVEQAEAALVEHYPRLVRLAYLVLPPHLGRNRRVLTAHSLVQRALPRGRGGRPQRSGPGASGVPLPRGGEGQDAPGEASTRERAHTFVRRQVLRQALAAEPPLLRGRWPSRAQLPPLLPQVWGLRLFPRSGGADELALDQRLAALSGAGRAAYVLRGLEQLDDPALREILVAAGVTEPDAALAEADTVPPSPLLESAEFDPCSLQARPTDLMRRRQHTRAALAALAALVVCGVLLATSGQDAAQRGNPAADLALDPGQLTRVAPAAWRTADRADFSAWPARGNLTEDQGLLRRALADWAAPGEAARVSATPGTPTGPAMGPPQLLYAGELDGARIVLLHDGLRLVRYAEPIAGDDGRGTALDLARVDAATEATANAVVLARTDSEVRYLTAPWADQVSVRDLLDPAAAPRTLARDTAGVTAPVAASSMARDCRTWDAMEVRDSSGTRTLTDLGELVPARLTAGPAESPADLRTASDRAGWARTACTLPTLRSRGVRSVNSWTYATQTLPDAGGTARWLCTRAETWRGPGSRVFAQFQSPVVGRGLPGAIAARAEDSAACGAKRPEVLAGVLWKSKTQKWYLLAAGNDRLTSLSASGGVNGSAQGNLLALPAHQGDQAALSGKLADGTRVNLLR